MVPGDMDTVRLERTRFHGRPDPLAGGREMTHMSHADMAFVLGIIAWVFVVWGIVHKSEESIKGEHTKGIAVLFVAALILSIVAGCLVYTGQY